MLGQEVVGERREGTDHSDSVTKDYLITQTGWFWFFKLINESRLEGKYYGFQSVDIYQLLPTYDRSIVNLSAKEEKLLNWNPPSGNLPETFAWNSNSIFYSDFHGRCAIEAIVQRTRGYPILGSVQGPLRNLLLWKVSPAQGRGAEAEWSFNSFQSKPFRGSTYAIALSVWGCEPP